MCAGGAFAAVDELTAIVRIAVDNHDVIPRFAVDHLHFSRPDTAIIIALHVGHQGGPLCRR
jgi:hypothetical protein